jgi:prohibitin 2
MSQRYYNEPRTITVNPQPIFRAVTAAVLVFAVLVMVSSAMYIVQPGFRGVEITLGNVAPEFRPEGFGFKKPFITRIQPMSIRQQTRAMPAECYSSELQQVRMQLNVLYRVPEHSVVRVFREFAGEPFENLIAPRIQEALKEVTATLSAEMIVRNREEVKTRSLELAQRKVGTNFLDIVDLVLYDINLSPELEQAIELKMVQEQDAAKARFTQLKAEIEAETAIIRAKGEAEAIQVRGLALRSNPDFIKLQVIQNWNGKSPLVVGTDSGASLLLATEEAGRAPGQPLLPAARPPRGNTPTR